MLVKTSERKAKRRSRVELARLPVIAACLFGVILLAQTPAGAAPKPRAVWIDTDLSLGSPLREVDDAYALIVAARAPELQISGISSTYGNAPLRATTLRTRDLLRRLGLEMPVHPGATAARNLGRATEASAALAHVTRNERRLTYIALGPLTNLASFLHLHPEAAGALEQVIMVAGKSPEATLGFGPGEKFRIHDANAFKDPAAVRLLLQSHIPILLVPIETSSRLLVRREDLQSLQQSTPTARYLARKSALWLWFWTHIPRAKGGPIFDALAVVAAAQPSLVRRETRSAGLDQKGDLIVARRAKGRARKVSFITGFDSATKDFVFSRLRSAR